MNTTILWLRNSLRMTDHAAMLAAAAKNGQLLPVYVHDTRADAQTAWGFTRCGPHRRVFYRAALDDLRIQLERAGSGLLETSGLPATVLPELAHAVGARCAVTEVIEAPEEQADVIALRNAGLQVETIWQSSMLDPKTLPHAQDDVPDVFTAFRQQLEHAEILPPRPLRAATELPPLPSRTAWQAFDVRPDLPQDETRSRCRSFPYRDQAFSGGETAAAAHLAEYIRKKLPHTYKQTRNNLSGIDFSSKFSPWLANGALSARSVYWSLKQFERDFGANESSYWLWFELLWRDYFQLLHRKYGRRLYRAGGLTTLAAPPHDTAAFNRWISGTTGNPLIDAGMRELAATGYLSNRMRQITASYLLHELACDFRAGAAWFETQLIDYDVYSNQGNWLYIAGRGTDPRGGRRFNPEKQAREYDPTGEYRALWSECGTTPAS